jgi:hypothetical protein
MKIGILGSGPVAQQLGLGFIKEGYEVKLGTRDKSKLNDWLKKAGSKASVGSFEEAAKFGEEIVLAVKGSVAEKVIKSAGKHNLSGKIIMDTTNPISDQPPTNGVLHFFTSLEDSLMERLQKSVPDAKFVKVFNIVGNASMYKPEYKDGTPTMFICGNDENAKKRVNDILLSFGWEIEDQGKAEAARAIEPLCILWCINGFLKNEWSHAFKLLKN